MCCLCTSPAGLNRLLPLIESAGSLCWSTPAGHSNLLLRPYWSVCAGFVSCTRHHWAWERSANLLYCMHVLASNGFPGPHPSLWCRNYLPLDLREWSVLSAGKLVWRPQLKCKSKAQAQTLHPCCLWEEQTSATMQEPIIDALERRAATANPPCLYSAGEAGPPGHCGAHHRYTHHSAHGEPPAVSAILLPMNLGCAASGCVCRPLLHLGAAPVLGSAWSGARLRRCRAALPSWVAAAITFVHGVACTTPEELRSFLHSTGMLALLQSDCI